MDTNNTLTKKSISSLFDVFFNDFDRNFLYDKMSTPSTNVMETEKSYKVEVLAPGFKKEDFKIDIENNVLKISSTVSNEKNESSDKWIRKEFSRSSFSRKFNLDPSKVDLQSISASYNDGILLIEISKSQKEERKMNIQVK